MAGVVVRADKALIGCNQMLNVFLLAGTFGAWQVLLALICCNQMLNVFLLAGTFGAWQVLLYVPMKL